jgi:hypothetical protein
MALISTKSVLTSAAAAAADRLAEEVPPDPTTVLSALLDSVRSPRARKLERGSLERALGLCDELKTHLSGMLDGVVTAYSGVAEAVTGAQRATELTAACDSQVTSESEVTSESDTPTSTKPRSRPNAKTRARHLRRQQEWQWRQWQDQQGQQAQQAQQNHQAQQGQRHATASGSPPLPGVLEQQEQCFRESLWNGVWVVAPVVPAPETAAPHVASPPPGSASGDSVASAPRARVSGGAPVRVPPALGHATFRAGMWGGSWQMVTAQVEPSEAGRLLFQRRVQRCLKVHRWMRMQRVWTDWMRGQDESES